MALQGTDVSEFQGQPDWVTLKANYQFAVIRASFGTARADNSFAYNMAGARSVGIGHGFYHYAYPQYNTAELEAAFFASTVGRLEVGEFVALDFEESYIAPVDWSLAFLKAAQGHFGVKPLIYINQALNDSHDWTPVATENFGLWAADWSATPNPDAWPFVAIWQDSNHAAAGGGDHDQFLGDAEQLTLYGYRGQPVSIPTVSVPAPLPPPAPTLPPLTQVTVASGDTFSLIAARHGVTLASLEAANPQIKNPNLIYPGEVVYLPGLNMAVYHVKPGDSLSSIAARFNLSLGALEGKNPQIKNPNLIFVGEIVYV